MKREFGTIWFSLSCLADLSFKPCASFVYKNNEPVYNILWSSQR